MRRALLLVLLLVPALLPPPARAWGSKGHEVVGFLADRHLSAETRTALREFCRSPSLAYVANWADAIRDDRPETAPWHYVNLAPGAAAFDPAQDVPPEGSVVDRIEHFRTVLADRSAPAAARLEALRWLVHLVGDVHQPLHCSREEDRGGNAIRVRYAGRDTNLHAVWDTDLVEAQGLGALDYARALDADLRPEDVLRWSGGTPAEWATESWRLALEVAYRDAHGADVKDGATLGRAYLVTRTPVVDRRLAQAGLRLAALLNAALAE